jgi:hypothetical protein
VDGVRARAVVSWARLLEVLGLGGGDTAQLVDAIGRRQFLRTLSSTALVATAAALVPGGDLERLIWIPGEKTIFLPSLDDGPVLLLTPEWVVRDAMRVLTNNLQFVKALNRDYDEHMLQRGGQMGLLVPMRYR